MMAILHSVRLAAAVVLAVSVAGVAHAAPESGTWDSSGSLPAAGENRLWDVAAVSSRDVWAAGGQDIKDRSGRPLALRFDGAKWTEYPVPGDADDQLIRVVPVSGNEVWGAKNGWQDARAGQVGLVRFDGAKWSEVTIAPVAGGTEAGLFDVRPFASDDVWVLGNTGDSPNGKPYVQRFDGTSWKVLLAPESGYYYTFAGDAKHPILVGNVGTRPSVQRWDGNAWQPMALPDIGDAFLIKIIERGGNLLAVGNSYTPEEMARAAAPKDVTRRAGLGQRLPVAVELVGGTWVRRDVPAVLGELTHAAADDRGNAWLTGQRGTGAREPYFLRYDGTSWTEAALGAGLSGKPANFFGITTVPGGQDVLAVGGAGELTTASPNLLAKLTR